MRKNDGKRGFGLKITKKKKSSIISNYKGRKERIKRRTTRVSNGRKVVEEYLECILSFVHFHTF